MFVVSMVFGLELLKSAILHYVCFKKITKARLTAVISISEMKCIKTFANHKVLQHVNHILVFNLCLFTYNVIKTLFNFFLNAPKLWQ